MLMFTDRFGKVNTKTEYISVHVQSSIESMNELTPVQKFYNGQSIFITGGTGCLGKLIVEKLLRECHGITCIYLLILAIEDDCSLPNFSISMIDRAILIREVLIVCNVAATSFVYVSTIYSNYLQNPIEEKFYDPLIDADKLINLMNCMKEKLFDDVTPQYLRLIKEHGDSIPTGIFRPGIVISTYQEPVLEWIDKEYGPVGITASVLMGLIFKEDFCIYNYVSKDNLISYGGYVEMILRYRDLISSEKVIWCHSFKIIKYWLVHLFYVFFLRLLPVFIIYTIAVYVGKQTRSNVTLLNKKWNDEKTSRDYNNCYSGINTISLFRWITKMDYNDTS
ncbi:fatty acyl-CoA reductase wat-like isoform X1 [Vespula maculifrons]|uniref:Fatty acyl-CoA reductase n=1 Tax=Vespula maculifrons TaxID=7453 RepID=A0ABD2CVN2_VESMC